MLSRLVAQFRVMDRAYCVGWRLRCRSEGAGHATSSSSTAWWHHSRDARERESSLVAVATIPKCRISHTASAGRACNLTYCKPNPNSSPNSLCHSHGTATDRVGCRPAHRCRLRAAAARAPVRTTISQKIDFTVVEEEARDFLDVSSVFLDSFWADKAGARELTAAQRRELRSGQLDDFRRRYALRRDTRRKATLFVAKDGSTIIGCAGVELDGAVG